MRACGSRRKEVIRECNLAADELRVFAAAILDRCQSPETSAAGEAPCESWLFDSAPIHFSDFCLTEERIVIIELDIEEILRGEFGDGGESIARVIMRQIIESATSDIEEQVQSVIREEISSRVAEAVQSTTAEVVQQVAKELLDTEYTPIDRWGDKKKATTLREQLHSQLTEQCAFEKRSNSYDQNAYTRAVIAAAESKMKEFQAEFSRQVDGEFVRNAINHATTELKKKLGVA